MNKNLFIYSFKYLAVLLALVTFSSCERDEFTEQDAFDLQQAQLNAQDAREQAALAAQDQRVMNMAMFRRSMDSLTRLNSGGKVFYTVNVVPGGSSAFSSGRFEEVEGLDGATVTVSQLGGAVVEQKTTVGGLASFEMYSGEVTVNVEAANHTDLNYTANLTPDGGVPNGALMYVGNVVPVFDDPNNPGAGADENMATVKGFAFAELDITFGNNQEESVPDGTKVRAFIDVANPAFKAKYITQANDEGINNAGQPTKSGYIQRFAYEEAASTTGSTVTSPLNNDTAPDGGEYSISIGATASGLPIMMKFDDFAADRTYYFSDSDTDVGGPNGQFGGPGAKRFIYTQNTAVGGNQTPTPIGLQGLRNFAFGNTLPVFSFATTEATATATITGGDVIAAVNVGDRGFYYEAPMVTIGAPTSGTTATAVAVLEDIPAAATGDAADARDRGLMRIKQINVTSGGSGYTGTPSVTITRKSYTGRDAAGVPVPNGTGAVAAPSSTVKYIRIMDGGYGMNPSTAGPSTGVGTYTGVAPAVVFNNDISPTGNGSDIATANVIVDETVGTATEVQITGGGNGYDDSNLNITFNYGSNASVSLSAGNDAIFRSNGTGVLQWNTAAPGAVLTMGGVNNEVQSSTGSNYTFVPSVSVTGLAAVSAGATLGTAPEIRATVDGTGAVQSLEIVGATGYSNSGQFNANINIIDNPDGVNITAQGFTQGGSIDSYILTNYGSTNGVYKATLENATPTAATFNYLTTRNDGTGVIVDEGDNAVAGQPGAGVNAPTMAEVSDFIVVFENPTATGGDNAWGYPIFDNGGNNLVGIFITQQGIGYTNPAPNTYNFWLVPADIAGTAKAALAKYKGLNDDDDANASASAARSGQRLTITFTNGGLGYAVRPEFTLFGGNKSVEDLAGINSGINAAVRGQLDFNAAGTITNTAINYTGALPFSAADLASDPITITASTSRLVGIFNREMDYFANNGGGYQGGIIADTPNGIDLNGPADWEYYNQTGGTEVTPRVMFNLVESLEFTAADRVGTNGAANADFKYITPPTYTVQWIGVDTGGAGVAVLDPATADIVALNASSNGSIPGGFVISNFFVPTNDPSYPAAGERFRTIGGSSNFEVFSGLTYIRDVNYGTGIELE